MLEIFYDHTESRWLLPRIVMSHIITENQRNSFIWTKAQWSTSNLMNNLILRQTMWVHLLNAWTGLPNFILATAIFANFQPSWLLSQMAQLHLATMPTWLRPGIESGSTLYWIMWIWHEEESHLLMSLLIKSKTWLLLVAKLLADSAALSTIL